MNNNEENINNNIEGDDVVAPTAAGLTLTGDSGRHIETEEVEDLVAENGGVTVVEVTRPLRPAAAESFCDVLTTTGARNSIVDLTLNNIIATLPFDVGLQILAQFNDVLAYSPSLQKINLSVNALGSRGVEVLEQLLGSPAVRVIMLNDCGLDADAAGIIFRATRADQVTHLSLDNNNFGTAGCAYIGQLVGSCRQLQHLSVGSLRGPDRQFTLPICLGLLTGRSAAMTHLNLDGLVMKTDRILGALGLAFREFSNLKVVSLRDCSIEFEEEDEDSKLAPIGEEGEEDEGSETLLSEDEEEGSDEEGQFYNGEAEEGSDAESDATAANCLAPLVVALIASGAPLQKVNMGLNDLGGRGALELVSLVENFRATLKELHIDECGIDDYGFAELVNAFYESEDNLPLEVMNASGNDISADGARALLDPGCEKLAEVQAIDLQNNDIGRGRVTELRYEFGDNVVLADDNDDEEDVDEDDDDDEDYELSQTFSQMNFNGDF